MSTKSSTRKTTRGAAGSDRTAKKSVASKPMKASPADSLRVGKKKPKK
jgi:hypothetical protein